MSVDWKKVFEWLNRARIVIAIIIGISAAITTIILWGSVIYHFFKKILSVSVTINNYQLVLIIETIISIIVILLVIWLLNKIKPSGISLSNFIKEKLGDKSIYFINTYLVLQAFILVFSSIIVYNWVSAEYNSIVVMIDDFTRTDEDLKRLDFEGDLMKDLDFRIKHYPYLIGKVDIKRYSPDKNEERDMVIQATIGRKPQTRSDSIPNHRVYIYPKIQVYANEVDRNQSEVKLGPIELESKTVGTFELPKQLITEPIQLACLIIGYRYLYNNEIEFARLHFEEAFRFEDSGSTLKTNKAEAARFIGVYYQYMLKDTVNSEHYYREAIKLDPNFNRPYYNLAVLLYKKGNKQEALLILNHADSIRGDDYVGLYFKGDILESENEFDNALECYQTVKIRLELIDEENRTDLENSLLNDTKNKINELEKKIQ